MKLCLLKEIAPKLSNEQIYKFPDKIFFIMNILKKGRVLPKTIEQEIIKILQKMEEVIYYAFQIMSTKR